MPTYSLLPSGETATELVVPSVRWIRPISWPVAGSTTITATPAATYRWPSGPLVSTLEAEPDTPPMAGTSTEDVCASVWAL